jgi:peroxiredoxin
LNTTKMKHILSVLFCVSMFFLSPAQEKPEGLFINSKAPDFKVMQVNGKDVRLRDIIKDSLVVLVFYRGQWCPYCNRHLKKLEDSLSFIKQKGARLIAVTPEKPEYIKKTIEKTNASYPIVYDKEMKIMKAYNVAFEVDEQTLARYKRADIDIAEANGQKDKVYLPVPALFVISKEGTILYRFFEPDYKKRPSVKEILEQLQ